MDGVVVLIRDGEEYLLVEQGKEPYRGKWGPVHGAMEEGEIQEEAVVRETREEVGLVVDPIERIAKTPADYKVDKLHWWTAEREKGKIAVDESEISDYGFFGMDEVFDLPLLPQAQNFFEEYENSLRGKE